MNINELLVTKPQQQPPDKEIHGKENKVRLSDFLQYPILDDPEPEPEPESETDDIVLRDLKVPALPPKAALFISRLVEATGTLEVLHILHDAYQMYCDGELIIDIEADEWPDFWEVVLGDGKPAELSGEYL